MTAHLWREMFTPAFTADVACATVAWPGFEGQGHKESVGWKLPAESVVKTLVRES